MARPTKAKQVQNETRILEMFERGVSALRASQLLKLNRNTVSSYYRIFGQRLIEDMNEDFIERQKIKKTLLVASLEKEIDDLEEQAAFTRISIEDDRENTALRNLLLSITVAKANLKQQIADIEMSPTLDVSLDRLVEERLDEIAGSHESEKTK